MIEINYELKLAEIFSINPKEFSSFEVLDPFNNNFLLEGAICRRADYRYGALGIFAINGEPTEQIIYATPKLHYPFDKNGKYLWAPLTNLKIFNKLDGTNITAIHYEFEGRDFVTYKTRLTPTLIDGRFGSFLSMWIEYLQKNVWVEKVISAYPNYNLSFEMYGSRNPILVKYDVSLEVALLFGVDRKTAEIVPPNYLNSPDVKIPFKFDFTGEDQTQIYKQARIKMSQKIQSYEGEGFPLEGMVFYGKNSDGWKMFKCKSEEIEKIHWAAGGISRNAIFTTCVNAYESYPEPTIENVITLLKEEFSEEQIGKGQIRIGIVFEEVAKHMVMVKLVNDIWKLANEAGFDITKDKAGTLRFVSKYFKKQEMRKVGTIILKQANLI